MSMTSPSSFFFLLSSFFFFTIIKKEKGKHRTFLHTFVHSYSFVIFSSFCKCVHRLAFRYFQKLL
ncbi:hypothetical protein BW894_23745 [Bacillus mycoides]|nr:hypothetical protein BW894_23745 [Bacillus mycoides]